MQVFNAVEGDMMLVEQRKHAALASGYGDDAYRQEVTKAFDREIERFRGFLRWAQSVIEDPKLDHTKVVTQSGKDKMLSLGDKMLDIDLGLAKRRYEARVYAANDREQMFHRERQRIQGEQEEREDYLSERERQLDELRRDNDQLELELLRDFYEKAVKDIK